VAAAVRSTPYASADELHVRRERTRLLAAFDEELVAPGKEAASRGRWFAAAAAVVAITAALVAWSARRQDRPARALEASGVAIHAEGAATWSEHTERDREVVVLERGALSIRVDHARNARRLLVKLPDGELEDTGTTFTVQVENAYTARVAVQEGSVLLRLHGRAPIAVKGGDVWTHAAPESPAAGGAGAATSSQPPPAVLSPPEVRRSPPRTGGSITTVPARDAFADFQTAVAALHRGDAREAAEGFAAFLANHLHDSRAEDAAYLRVIALQRCGDVTAMREAANAYLRRYPTGFRRAEVEALSPR
jgi:hypothetical protein